MRESTRRLHGRTIAYITPEVAIDQQLATYSGGLGVLAGAVGRGAAKLGLNLITVAPLQRYGYYEQTKTIHPELKKPWMGIAYVEHTYEGVLEDPNVIVPVTIHDTPTWAKAWRVPRGAFDGAGETVYLDTYVAQNDDISRSNGAYLYPSLACGGIPRHKVAQCKVLGSGAVAMLEALYGSVDLYCLNEVYSFGVIPELWTKYLNTGLSLSEAVALVKQKVVFTTHTPIKDGNPTFPLRDVREIFGDPRLDDLFGDCADADGWFNPMKFCLKHASMTNAVSKKHAQVTREWQGKEVTSVTNGSDVHFWQHRDFTLADTSDALAEAKCVHKRQLLDFVAGATGKRFSENVLTVVWARRFAEYKRPKLIMENRAWLEQLLRSNRLQLIFSGKPHPEDSAMISVWSDILNYGGSVPNLVILPGYELEMSRILKCGADVWLNTPRAPLEACGTSGQSAAMNAGLNCSTVDGWMCEAERANFFPFGVERAATSFEQDALDAALLREVFEGTILPMYMTDKSTWYEMALRAKREAEEHWSATRMVEDYCERVYGKVLADAQIYQFPQPLKTAA